MPLVFFPFVLSSLSDTFVALRRIGDFLTAEDLPEPYDIKDSLKGIAVDADGDFIWETVGKPNQGGGSKFGAGAHGHGGKGSHGKGNKDKKGEAKGEKDVLPQHAEKHDDVDEKDGHSVESTVEEEEKPFQLKNVKIMVPKGSFVGIVGRVGSGKVGIR